ncbi:hypothetical protein BpHYR1_006211 [Brachionus plicatilis]|uniref:Uncharacterized protein n=1 Tax=Brachionus plicatilis TaxID=10195 RepID=A0A3M7Q1P7_BRAPC|nr:hypothetical protein BpHYR1_006211 [Brachionus plicatilis]
MGEMVFIACAKVVFRVVRLQYRTREYEFFSFLLNIKLRIQNYFSRIKKRRKKEKLFNFKSVSAYK